MRHVFLLTITFLSIIWYFLVPYKGSSLELSGLLQDSWKEVSLRKEPWASINLVKVAEGFSLPTYIAHSGDGSGRLFVVEKAGLIWIIKDGKRLERPFLDITNKVRSRETERGLLSIAFHPGYKENGRFFVNYTDLKGDTVVAEYRVSRNPDYALYSSERMVLHIPQPASNHNGGQLQFGPNGYLYIGTGDGGSGGDPWGNAQNKEVLLGKILRIDVDKGLPYAIPRYNPFIGERGTRYEIWAYGLRNPWRFSFDSLTGDLYIADVGQDDWEEINIQLGISKRGENYGWNIMEGKHCFKPRAECNTSGLTWPIVEYGHDLGCSITGGYVYRGRRFKNLFGTYFFGDFCSGRIWGLHVNQRGRWEWAEFLRKNIRISSFGEDEDGEIYVIDYFKGTIYQITGQ